MVGLHATKLAMGMCLAATLVSAVHASGRRAVSVDELINAPLISLEDLAESEAQWRYLGSDALAHYVGYVDVVVTESRSGRPTMPWSHPVVHQLEREQADIAPETFTVESGVTYIPNNPRVLSVEPDKRTLTVEVR